MTYDDEGELKKLKKNRKMKVPRGKHILWSILIVLIGILPLALIGAIIALLAIYL